MSDVDRCTCTPYFQDAGGGYTEYVPEWDPSCPQHGEVDHILHSGEYIDRRGRRWVRSHFNNWTAPRPARVCALADESQMRLLIERDQHQGECVGLRDCCVHPVPRIFFHDWLWSVVAPGLQAWKDSRYAEFADAVDAARALAVEA